jgi:hypothetical protein
MSTTRVNVRSANRAIILLDGVRVALAKSLRASDDYGHSPEYGVGDIHAQEIVPTAARHTISLTQTAVKTQALRSLGIFAENGDDVLQGREFDILEQDKDTGDVLRKYIGCVYTSGDHSLDANQVVRGTAQFMCRDVQGVGL